MCTDKQWSSTLLEDLIRHRSLQGFRCPRSTPGRCRDQPPEGEPCITYDMMMMHIAHVCMHKVLGERNLFYFLSLVCMLQHQVKLYIVNKHRIYDTLYPPLHRASCCPSQARSIHYKRNMVGSPLCAPTDVALMCS